MRRLGVLTLVLLAAAVCSVFAAAAPGRSSGPRCRASTRLGEDPHELLLRVHCSFDVDFVEADLEAPAVLTRVQRHPRLKHGDEEDHFRCLRDGNAARCKGIMGSEVTLVGSLRIRGNRCKTATDFGIRGGPECDNEGSGFVCPAIGYYAKLRDPQPSGCG